MMDLSVCELSYILYLPFSVSNYQFADSLACPDNEFQLVLVKVKITLDP
jgi:hypothetical protein